MKHTYRQPVTLANGQPAWTRRKSGIVTQAMINEHGSYRAALDWLNGKAA